MLIERIPEWSLTADDDAAIAALLARSFDTDFGGRSFYSQHHHLRLVLRDGPQIIGHIAETSAVHPTRGSDDDNCRSGRGRD